MRISSVFLTEVLDIIALKKHKYTHCRVLLVTTKFRQKFYRTAINRFN